MNSGDGTDYKTVRGLTRGLLLLNLLNKFDGGASTATLAEFSGLHRTTVRRLLETLQEEGYVRRSLSDDSFRLTLKVRQLSEGFRDEHWISALATPLLGELLREVIWPTDLTTLDVDAMVVRETTHRFSRLSFHRSMVGRRLPLLLTASGLTWLAFSPDSERQPIIDMLAGRPEEEYQLAREPEKLHAIPRTNAAKRLWRELPGLAARAENCLHRRSGAQPGARHRLSQPCLYRQSDDHRAGGGETFGGITAGHPAN
ncbi:YiaKLMNOPQRS operon repressor [Kluyvera cryocrescens]|uniref:YiaKLMNOPQRS operon repressor n=1 Tax=Kluyvera cryocrescens TaxID=580 RepID=A0A485C3P3_KLUCR|nr:YiaKLMNOPQRS operon repressor [Kluyvera cryocrescens]